MPRLNRASWTVLAVVLAAAPLTACSEDRPDPRPAAEQLAEALQAADPGLVDWQEPASEDELTSVLVEVTDVPRDVGVASLGEQYELDGGPAVDAELAWDWDLDDGDTDWTYTTTATLVLPEDADGWVARWAPGMVAPALTGSSDTLGMEREPAQRGQILSADGTPIVTDTPVLRLGIDKARGPEDEDEARAAATGLAELVGLTDPAAYADRVAAAGPSAFVEAIVVRTGSDVVDLAEVEILPGARALPDELPLAPTAAFARPVLGTAGEATQEIVAESDGAVAPGDLVGLSGLQRQYDELLRGTPGIRIVRRQDGAPGEVLVETTARQGADLTVTLDVGLQQAAEEVLAQTETPSGLVALQPSTGAVLAAASGTGSGGFSTATLGQYAPGSTFKVVSTLALLRSGMTAQSAVECTPSAVVSGYTFENYPAYPAEHETTIPLRLAIAHSCNTALINARDQVPAEDVAAAAGALGVGQSNPEGWPGFLGAVPEDATGTEHAASLIGQGQVLASPLAVATMAASVADGAAVSPVLVVGPPEVADDPASAPAQPLTTEEAEQLREMMRAVVQEGTGTQLADVPGPPVSAKTGTAESGSGDDARLDSWMVAFQGDLAVAVVVEAGGEGTQAAGPVVEDFLRAVG